MIPGAGQQHVEAWFRTEEALSHRSDTQSAQDAYRETIRGKAEVQGRHKKQTGGHGQYGDCKIRMEPPARGGHSSSRMKFRRLHSSELYSGGGKRNRGGGGARISGWFPVVDFRVILYDGTYHDVDSTDVLQDGRRIAFRKAWSRPSPLLEPIMTVEITVPDEFAGTIMGELNGRRGRIQGMESKGGGPVVKAEVPMAEMLTYGFD